MILIVLLPHPALLHGRTQHALSKDEVNHVGEAIAFVVAEDRYVAEDAVARIRVDYELLEPVVGIAASREARTLVHDDVPTERRRQHGDAQAKAQGAIR